MRTLPTVRLSRGIVVCAVVVAGCGGGDDEAGDRPPATSAPDPPAATAAPKGDDAAVLRVYESRDADFKRLGKETRAAIGAWQESGNKREEPVLRVIEETRQTLRELRTAVQAEEPSSPRGAEGKKLALEALELFDRSQVLATKGVKDVTAGKASGQRTLDEAEELLDSSAKPSKRAVKLLGKKGGAG